MYTSYQTHMVDMQRNDAATILKLYCQNKESRLSMFLDSLSHQRLLSAFNLLQAPGHSRMLYVRCGKFEHRHGSLMFVVNDGSDTMLFLPRTRTKFTSWDSYCASTNTICDQSCSVRNAEVLEYERFPVLVQNWRRAACVLPTLLGSEFNVFDAESWLRTGLRISIDDDHITNRPMPQSVIQGFGT